MYQPLKDTAVGNAANVPCLEVAERRDGIPAQTQQLELPDGGMLDLHFQRLQLSLAHQFHSRHFNHRGLEDNK